MSESAVWLMGAVSGISKIVHNSNVGSPIDFGDSPSLRSRRDVGSLCSVFGVQHYCTVIFLSVKRAVFFFFFHSPPPPAVSLSTVYHSKRPETPLRVLTRAGCAWEAMGHDRILACKPTSLQRMCAVYTNSDLFPLTHRIVLLHVICFQHAKVGDRQKYRSLIHVRHHPQLRSS